jgi:hypothetical protein
MKYTYTFILCGLSLITNAQRVYISDDVSRFDALVYEEKDPSVPVSWLICVTDNPDPTIWGNWNLVNSKDSATYVLKNAGTRQSAFFTYRLVDDSTATNFSLSDKMLDVFSLDNYAFVNDAEEADLVICVTPNKWLADEIIYLTEEESFTKSFFWTLAKPGEPAAVKVYITTNRLVADKLIYFTNNPLEARIKR